MSILNFTANDLKQINDRTIERLRSQDNRAEVKRGERSRDTVAIAASNGKIVDYKMGAGGAGEAQVGALGMDGRVVIIRPHSPTANFSKEQIRHFFKVAKRKLSEAE